VFRERSEAPAPRPMKPRRQTGTEAACEGAAEVAIRTRRMKAAYDQGDTDAYVHARLARGFASSDVEHARRYELPVAPAPRKVVRPPRPRRDRRLKGGRPRARRVASRSAGGGSSGDSDPDHLDEPPRAAS